MPQYKLYYFDIRGLAEPIRLTFVQAGVDFEDVRMKYDDWPNHKPNMPFGQVPVLEVDGKKLTQSAAIMRYIARKHGMVADDPWDEAIGDEIASSWFDMSVKLYSSGIFSETDKDAKKKKCQQLVDEFLKPRLQIYENRLAGSKSGFFAGNKATWADLSSYTWLTMVRDFLKCPLNDYPKLSQFIKTIEALPKIKAWHDKHPNVAWSVMPSPMD